MVRVWTRTVIDAVKTIAIQHLEIQKKAKTMKTVSQDLLMQNKIFAGIILATGLLLLVPLLAMHFNTGVNWSLMDFVIAGGLIFGAASLFLLIARRFDSKKQRIVIGLACAVFFLYIWAELAVGVFTKLGS